MSLRLISSIASKTSLLGLGSFKTPARKLTLFSGNYFAEKAVPLSLCRRVISLTGNGPVSGCDKYKSEKVAGCERDSVSKWNPTRSYSITKAFSSQLQYYFASSILAPPLSTPATGLTCLPSSPLIEPTRNITKLSFQKGRRKTAAAVKNRFLRLDWGAWISPQPGRARHLWKKPIQLRNKLKNHILRTAWEGKFLDKMVTKYWIKKKWFVDDPYESYHTRDNYAFTKDVKGIDSTRLYATKPLTRRRYNWDNRKPRLPQ